VADDEKDKKPADKPAEGGGAKDDEAVKADDVAKDEAKADADAPKVDADAGAPKDDADAGAPKDDAKEEAAKASGAKDDEDDDDASEDAYRPEEIAKRIDTVGEESDIERVAREEEKKLAERRKQQRKAGGKKKGLETAASKRLAKIGEKTVKRPVSIAVDAGDPLLDRTAKLSRWAKSNKKTVGGILLLGVLGLGGWGIWRHLEEKKANAASLILSAAVADERGRIGDPEKDEDPQNQVKDPRPVFKTNELRLDAALAKYREVQSKFPGTGAAMLGRLGEAAILLDKKDFAGAITAYNDVKGSPLAQADVQVKARAVEGLGFANELKAVAKREDEKEKDKALGDALAAFKDLSSVEGFQTLGQYHMARVHEAKGDKAEAIKVLKDIHEKISKPGEKHPYLQTAVDDRLRALDPSAVPAKPPPNPFGGMDSDDPELQRMIQEMMKKKQQGGGKK
jgi:hypothetical protein